MKKYFIFAILLGSVFVIMYTAYGIAFWYGSNLIVEGISTPGSIFTVNSYYNYEKTFVIILIDVHRFSSV
jgi:hypothetical protein